jgi:hypothetical protein
VAKKPEEQEVKYKFPKTVGACLAKLEELCDRIDGMEAQLAPVKKQESALREHMIATFAKEKLRGARGQSRSLSVVSQVVPVLEDWAAFFKFASRKGNDDLVQRSVKVDAWRERVEAGKQVPGTGSFTRVSLRVERIKEK